MEKSWEIERIFNQDSFAKKKIGSNVHKMTGKGKKGGIKGGMQFPKNNFKRYEKNSKTEVYTMDKVVDFKIFNSYGDDRKRELLIEWKRRHSNKDIAQEMGISVSKLSNLLRKYNINDEDVKNIVLSKQQMDDYKDNPLDNYQYFTNLIPEQQKELMDHYLERMTMRELSKFWGITYQTTSKLKNRLKGINIIEPIEEETSNQEPDINLFINEGNNNDLDDETEEEFEESNQQYHNIIKKDQFGKQEENTNGDMVINYEETNTGFEVVNKWGQIIGLINNSNIYKISLKVEKANSENYKWDDVTQMLKRLLESHK